MTTGNMSEIMRKALDTAGALAHDAEGWDGEEPRSLLIVVEPGLVQTVAQGCGYEEVGDLGYYGSGICEAIGDNPVKATVAVNDGGLACKVDRVKPTVPTEGGAVDE